MKIVGQNGEGSRICVDVMSVKGVWRCGWLAGWVAGWRVEGVGSGRGDWKGS